MRMNWILLTALALGGCKSVADIERRPAIAAYSSQRSVADLATCIALALGNRGAQTKMTETAEGVIISESIVVAGLPSVVGAVVITEKGGARVVSVHSVGKAPTDVARVDAIYRPCL